MKAIVMAAMVMIGIGLPTAFAQETYMIATDREQYGVDDTMRIDGFVTDHPMLADRSFLGIRGPDGTVYSEKVQSGEFVSNLPVKHVFSGYGEYELMLGAGSAEDVTATFYVVAEPTAAGNIDNAYEMFSSGERHLGLVHLTYWCIVEYADNCPEWKDIGIGWIGLFWPLFALTIIIVIIVAAIRYAKGRKGRASSKRLKKSRMFGVGLGPARDTYDFPKKWQCQGSRIGGDGKVILDTNTLLSSLNGSIGIAPHVESRLAIPDDVYREAYGIHVKRQGGDPNAIESHRDRIQKIDDYSYYLREIERIQMRACGLPDSKLANDWIWGKLRTVVEQYGIEQWMMRTPDGRIRALRRLYEDAASDRIIIAKAAMMVRDGGGYLVTEDADMLVFAREIEAMTGGKLKLARGSSLG